MEQTANSARKPEYGTRDARGNWKPPYPAHFAPLFDWPVRPKAILIWLFGFPGWLWPFNTIVFLLASITVSYLQPPLETTKNLEIGWIAWMLLRNLVIMVVAYGGMHTIYYTLKLGDKERKYNPSYGDEPRKQFLFGKQIWDNVFRCLTSALPIWTAYEVLYVWAAGNHWIPYLSFRDSPAGFVAWFFVILLFRDTHFYFVHRLIHWKPLFKYVHSAHHLNPNPAPWSGLSMHPVEHLLYYSGVLIHFIIPSNPLHFFFHTQHLTIAPIIGHLGFEGPRFNGKPITSDYFHYLHHKYYTCNFGGETVPWDRWLGVYYTGEGEYRTKSKKVSG